jgi:hypothetical protein
MFDIEITPPADRNLYYRLFEIMPGFLTWTILLAPFVLALTSTRLYTVCMMSFILLWLIKAIGINIRALQAFRMIGKHTKLDWRLLADDLDLKRAAKHTRSAGYPDWHTRLKSLYQRQDDLVCPDEVIHAVIIANYNEKYLILKPTIDSVLKASRNHDKLMIILAYEARGGADIAGQARRIKSEYGKSCMLFETIEHPDGIQNEVRGKGGNITFSGNWLLGYCKKNNIDTSKVIVTSLDADNRPHIKYFDALTYAFCAASDRHRIAYQPVPMYTNNIWDAPAPMRVIAVGNSYWMMIQGLRPHILRNFSAHSQSLDSLIETDFWSTRTIVEDGHQFWRSYFRFKGNFHVVPIFVPIYQDAVLSSTYRKTLKAQFIQIRRWAWGASDISYVAQKGWRSRGELNRLDLVAKFLRLLEGHVSWSTSPLLLTFGTFAPRVLGVNDFLTAQIPVIASKVQTIGSFSIIMTIYVGFRIMPKRQKHYSRIRYISHFLQWALLPVTTLTYSATAAIHSQTRLMFGWYLGTFDTTDKTVVTEEGKISSY